MSSEAKVGMFFLIAALLAAVIAVYLGDFWVRASSYQVTAYFRDIQGLPAGAEVRFAGVRIGKVLEVTLEDNPRYIGHPAAVRLGILRHTVLYQSDQFLVQQGALLGDKYVEVRRPPVRKMKQLAQGAVVEGSESTSLTSLTDEARSLIKEARQTLKAVHSVVATDFNREAVRLILTNVILATRKADQVAAQALQMAAILKKTATQVGPDVTVMAANLRQTSLSVKSTAQLVRTILATSPIPGEMAKASTNVRLTTEDLAAMSSNLRTVLADPATRTKLDKLLTNLQDTSENLSQLTGRAEQLLGDQKLEEDVRTALARLRAASDNLAVMTEHAKDLVTDPTVTADVKATVSNARQATAAGADAAAKAQKSLDRVDRTMDRLSEVTSGLRPEEVRPRVSVEANSHQGLRLDVEADLQYAQHPHDFWRVGVRDLGDGEKLTLQRSLPQGPNARARMGLLSNKLSVGYDFWLDRRLAVETDLYDPNELRFDLRGIYGVSPQADLLFGVSDVLSGTDPFVGIRYRSQR